MPSTHRARSDLTELSRHATLALPRIALRSRQPRPSIEGRAIVGLLRPVFIGLALLVAATGARSEGVQRPDSSAEDTLGVGARETRQQAAATPDSQAEFARYRRTWALWDAEGQHLTTEEVREIHRTFGAGILFFRSETKHGLDLELLKENGLMLIKVAHPGYAPFNQNDFIADASQLREWARAAAMNPAIDGVALDIEGYTATTHKSVLRVLAEEAHAQGKTVHAVPHFALFDRWEDVLTPQEINAYADVVWPWLYNRFRQPDYGQGLVAMLGYWRDHGVTVPTYPIFDHGRTDYSGIAPSEAREVPLHLMRAGVETVCLFQPHVSFRARTEVVDYAALWRNLATAYGGKGDGVSDALDE